MEFNLKHDKITCFKPVYNKTIVQEETSEAIVPDALPDIGQILDINACVLLRGKEAETGRVTVSGTVNASVLFVPEGGGSMEQLAVDIPFRIKDDAMEISQESSIVASVQIQTVDVRLIHSRKILIRATLVSRTVCYEQDTLEFSSDLEDAAEDSLQINRESHTLNLVHAVTEKTFLITDVYSLPGSSGDLSVLSHDVSLVCDEVQNVGSKLILKGFATVSILYDGGGELSCEKFQTPFSQIIELETNGENATQDIKIMLTGVYLNSDFAAEESKSDISVEIHAVAQCTVYDRIEVTALSDAYSTKYDVTNERSTVSVVSYAEPVSAIETAKEILDIDGTIQNILYATASPGSPSQEETGISLPVHTKVVYRSTDGQIEKAEKLAHIQIRAGEDSFHAGAAEVTVGEVTALAGATGAEVRFSVNCSLRTFREKQITSITNMQCDEDSPKDLSQMPSIVLKRVAPGDTLWGLAKAHNASAQQIVLLNELTAGAPLIEDQLLIIPKKR